MSIFDNVAYGMRLSTQQVPKRDIPDRVEQALRASSLWDEVKDKLHQSGLALSGGQQQRLCIARTVAVQPDVILMDEPASALDPISTLKIEELMFELERSFTIVIVTHNLQQAARVAEQTVFMTMNPETRAGFVVEAGPTQELFTKPRDSRTEDYITGRFG
jgi:phosphate transport system ATP-binding protein